MSTTLKTEVPVSDALNAARAGIREALGDVLESCRHYLLLIANAKLDPELRVAFGAADLVQETFVKAKERFCQFSGQTEAELRGWLRRILLHVLIDHARHIRGRENRHGRREVSLESLRLPVASCGLAAEAAPDVALIAEEELAHLRSAMAQLPEEYREVLRLRSTENCSFLAIGQNLGRSEEASRKLWNRAIGQLRDLMEPPGNGPR